jgi:hypothetical protein
LGTRIIIAMREWVSYHEHDEGRVRERVPRMQGSARKEVPMKLMQEGPDVMAQQSAKH